MLRFISHIMTFSFLLLMHQHAMAQEIAKKPTRGIMSKTEKVMKRFERSDGEKERRIITKPRSADEHGSLDIRTPGGLNSAEPGDSIWMVFSLEWTTCQMHRVNDDSPLEMLLSGSITSSDELCWNLFSVSPGEGLSPLLYFIEDIFGQSGPEYGTDIPLNWEFALDGGQFDPITLLPDNSLSVTFPPGDHTFQVRITGFPQTGQEDGYYNLQLGQEIIPQL
jgi:hypothetical protein